jgi:hypothetical protein
MSRRAVLCLESRAVNRLASGLELSALVVLLLTQIDVDISPQPTNEDRIPQILNVPL